MKRAIVVGLALLAFIAAPAAAQQPVEYKVTVQGETVRGSAADHFLTFSAPFQLPDVSLPAGTYVFTIIGPSIVQVTSPDRRHQYAMFFTAPLPQGNATGEFEMVFARTTETAPPRVAKWYLPYKTTGFEFLYPKTEAEGDR
jgi:hypothetical protein